MSTTAKIYTPPFRPSALGFFILGVLFKAPDPDVVVLVEITFSIEVAWTTRVYVLIDVSDTSLQEKKSLCKAFKKEMRDYRMVVIFQELVNTMSILEAIRLNSLFWQFLTYKVYPK